MLFSTPQLHQQQTWVCTVLESQKHKSLSSQGWKRCPEVTRSSASTQTRQPGINCPGPCPDHFLMSSGMDNSTISLSNLCQCSVTLTVQTFFPDAQEEHPMYQFVPIASCTVTGHNWKEPSLYPPFRHLYEWMRSLPEPFLSHFYTLPSAISIHL